MGQAGGLARVDPMEPDHAPFSADVATLSSTAAQLAELAARVTACADRFEEAKVVDAANDLYEVERLLLGAVRRLEHLTGRLH